MIDSKGKWIFQCPYCKNQDITVNQIKRIEFAALADFGKGLFDVLHCHCCSADLVIPKQKLDDVDGKILNMKIAIQALEKTKEIMAAKKQWDEQQNRNAERKKANKLRN